MGCRTCIAFLFYMDMKRDFDSMSFSEKEEICNNAFREGSPFWHLYTDGTKMQNIFCSDKEFDECMNMLAASACRVMHVQILTFELMTNHIHLILSGSKDACMELFMDYKNRIAKLFRKYGKVIDWSSFSANILAIENLKRLRNEIAYCNRNAFVANPQFTPFSYPWGGGCEYFGHRMISNSYYDTMTVRDMRTIIHSRDVSAFDKLKFRNGVVSISSFCNIELGMSMFQNARNYFYTISKNIEAFADIACRIRDSVCLIDEEIFSVAVKISSDMYGVNKLSLLAPDQKINLAKELRYKYFASIQQLRRILRLNADVLNEVFPSTK